MKPVQGQAGTPGSRNEAIKVKRAAGAAETAAQVVHHLQTGDRWKRSVPAQDPGEELPVAPHPAVLAGERHLVVARELLEHFDVADQARPGEAAFEEVVAEEGVFRNSAVQCSLEGVDLVYPFARVGTLAEQVLVEVADRGRIGVDPGRWEEHPLEEAGTPRSQKRGDPWLEDPVALHHPPERFIDPGPVERMSNGRHQPGRCPGR